MKYVWFFPFCRVDENMKAPRWCYVVTVNYNSYGEQLWRNSKLFCSLKSSFGTETTFLSACSSSLCFLALPLLAGRQAVPLPGEILFLKDYLVMLKCKKLPISQNSACSSGILLKSQDVSIFADLLQGPTTAPKVTCLYCQRGLYSLETSCFSFLSRETGPVVLACLLEGRI